MNSLRFANGRIWPILLLILLLLAACSTPAETAEETTETVVANEAVEPMAADEETTITSESRVVIDAAGNEVELPTNPQRVVALSERDMDAAFALGAPVVGVVDGRGAMAPPAYLQPNLGAAVSVGAFSAPSPEGILNLNPDLILIGGIFPALEELLPDLQQIAPVYISFNLGDDWKTAFLGTANALNQTAAAEAWLAEYDDYAAEIAASVPAGSTVSIVRFNPDGPVIMAPASFASTVLAEAGFTRPEAHIVIEGQGHGDTISQEALQTIDADYLFIGALNEEGTAVLETAVANPLFTALNAFQNDAVAVVDGAVWTTLGGPLAADSILDEVAGLLNSAGN